MTRRLVSNAVLLALAACIATAGARAQTASNPDGTAQVAEIPADQIPPAIRDAVNAPDRPADDKALDEGRQPAQMLAFFGIAPGMQVEDLFAGGGYTTELLARVVGKDGKVYSQNGEFPEKFKKILDAWKQRLAKPALANTVAVEKPFSAGDLLPVQPGSLDAVVMVLNYHDLIGEKADIGKINGEIFKALKPGGVYGIVDHSAQAGSGIRDVSTLHRIDQAVVIEQARQAGFQLAATSSALKHPEDDRTWFVFKHRGETDRFMLKFVKP